MSKYENRVTRASIYVAQFCKPLNDFAFHIQMLTRNMLVLKFQNLGGKVFSVKT